MTTTSDDNCRVPVITIDGSSGVGKGTVCQKVAENLSWHLLDSGSLYRLTALQASQQGVIEDIPQVVEIARNLDVEYRVSGGKLQVILQNENVTTAIRTEAIGAMASKIAAEPDLRQALLERQKVFATSPGLVADGRDMGTVIFPQAELKIFLTASTEERAKRRYKQLIEKGLSANLPTLVTELEARDERDTKRSTSPLCAADDAVVIDTTHIGIDQVVSQVMELVGERLKN